MFWHGAGGDGDDDGDGGGDDARWCVVAMVMEVIVRVIETIIISRSFVCACACACVCTFWSFGLHICICTIHIRVVAKELSRRPSTCSFGPYRGWLPRQTDIELASTPNRHRKSCTCTSCRRCLLVLCALERASVRVCVRVCVCMCTCMCAGF